MRFFLKFTGKLTGLHIEHLTKVSTRGLTSSDGVTAQQDRQQHTADHIPVTVSVIPRRATTSEAIAMCAGI